MLYFLYFLQYCIEHHLKGIAILKDLFQLKLGEKHEQIFKNGSIPSILDGH